MKKDNPDLSPGLLQNVIDFRTVEIPNRTPIIAARTKQFTNYILGLDDIYERYHESKKDFENIEHGQSSPTFQPQSESELLTASKPAAFFFEERRSPSPVHGQQDSFQTQQAQNQNYSSSPSPPPPPPPPRLLTPPPPSVNLDTKIYLRKSEVTDSFSPHLKDLFQKEVLNVPSEIVQAPHSNSRQPSPVNSVSVVDTGEDTALPLRGSSPIRGESGSLNHSTSRVFSEIEVGEAPHSNSIQPSPVNSVSVVGAREDTPSTQVKGCFGSCFSLLNASRRSQKKVPPKSVLVANLML